MAAEGTLVSDGLLDAARGLEDLRAASGQAVAESQQAPSNEGPLAQTSTPVFTEGQRSQMLLRIARLRQGAAEGGDIDSSDSLHAVLPAVRRPKRPAVRPATRGQTLKRNIRRQGESFIRFPAECCHQSTMGRVDCAGIAHCTCLSIPYCGPDRVFPDVFCTFLHLARVHQLQNYRHLYS